MYSLAKDQVVYTVSETVPFTACAFMESRGVCMCVLGLEPEADWRKQSFHLIESAAHPSRQPTVACQPDVSFPKK